MDFITRIIQVKSNYEDTVKQPLFECASGVFKVTLPNAYQSYLHRVFNESNRIL